MAAVVAKDEMERSGFTERLLYELWLNAFNKSPVGHKPVYERANLAVMTRIRK